MAAQQLAGLPGSVVGGLIVFPELFRGECLEGFLHHSDHYGGELPGRVKGLPHAGQVDGDQNEDGVTGAHGQPCVQGVYVGAGRNLVAE